MERSSLLPAFCGPPSSFSTPDAPGTMSLASPSAAATALGSTQLLVAVAVAADTVADVSLPWSAPVAPSGCHVAPGTSAT
eukprot:351140-Chlamydomonas_euryale.AAC.11